MSSLGLISKLSFAYFVGWWDVAAMKQELNGRGLIAKTCRRRFFGTANFRCQPKSHRRWWLSCIIPLN